MNLLHLMRKLPPVSRLAGLVIVLWLAVPAARAAVFYWDGGDGTSTAMNVLANFTPETTLPRISDEVHFSPGSVNPSYSTAITLPGTPVTSDGTASEAFTYVYQYLTFDAGAAAYTFSGDVPAGPTVGRLLRVEYGLVNNSSNTQTINVNMDFYRSDATTRGIQALAGDIIINGYVNIGTNRTDTQCWLAVRGSHNVEINGGLVGHNATPNYFTQMSTGMTTLGEAPIHSLNPSGGRFAGVINVNDGVLRITNSYSLGETAGNTVISTGNSTNYGRLELFSTTTPIDSPDPIRLGGRGASSRTHITNVAGNNTLSGPITVGTGGGYYNIESAGTAAGDLLTLAGTITATASSTRTLHLTGAGNGVVSGTIVDGSASNQWAMSKTGTGTWTLTNAGNTYGLDTVISGGTLKLTGDGAIPNTKSISVGSGCYFDVSGVTGGFKLGEVASQTLLDRGHVVGNVSVYGSGIISPGSGSTVRTLYFDNAAAQTNTLNLLAGSTLKFKLYPTPEDGNDKIVLAGNLSLPEFSTSNLQIVLRNNYVTNGTFRLLDYGGTLTGNAGNIYAPAPADTRVVYTVLTGNDAGGTANQINLVVSGLQDYLWQGSIASSDWELHGSAQNWTSTDHLFYDMDSVTFDDSGMNAAPVHLSTAVSPANLTFNNNVGHDYTFDGYGSLSVLNALTVNGSGKATLANYVTNSLPTINLASADGTLALAYPIDAAMTSTVSGIGKLRHEGLSVLTINGNLNSFAGSLAVQSGGTIKAGKDSALGGASAITSIEDGATLDVNSKNLGDAVVRVQGAGVGGQGAIINSADTFQPDALKYVEVTGDNVTFGSGRTDVNTNRWDIRDGYLKGTAGTYTLTKIGAHDIAFNNLDIDNNLGDINLQEGMLWFERKLTTDPAFRNETMGDPTKTLTIASGAMLGLWGDYPADAPQYTYTKNIVSDGGTIVNNDMVTLAGPVLLNADTAINCDWGTIIFSNTIGGTGGLIKNSGGLLVLTADGNSYGTTTVNAGTLQIGEAVTKSYSGGETGSLGNGDVALNGGSLTFQRNGAYTVANNISGTGTVTYNADGGIVTITGHNSYSGTTGLSHGIVILKTSDGLGDTTGVTTLRGDPTQTYKGQLILDGADAGGLVIGEKINASGTGGTDGKGLILNRSGANVLAGEITFTTGAGSPKIGVEGGTLDIQGLMRPNTGSRILYLGGNGDNGPANDGTVSGVISDGTSSTRTLTVAKVDSGTWTLTNANTYTLDTRLEGGTLAIVNANTMAIANMTSAFVFYGEHAATLDVTGASPEGYYPMGWDYYNTQTQVAQAIYGHGSVVGGVKTNNMSTLSPSGPSFAAGTLDISGNLILSGGNGTTSDILQFKLGSAGNDMIVVGGVLNAGNTSYPTLVSIVPNGTIAAGSYEVLHAGSQIAPSSAYFAMDPNGVQASSRQSFSVVNTVAGSVKVAVSGSVGNMDWNGTSAAWDVKTTTSWDGAADHQFYQGDHVTFGDAGTANLAVDLAATVYPGSITVNPTSAAYVLSGTGKISGVTGITVSGGTLTVATTGGNDFTGPVTVAAGGKFIVGNAAALGNNAFSLNPDAGTHLNGGTLDLGGQNVSSEVVIVGANGAIINDGAADSSLQIVAFTGNAIFGGSRAWNIQATTSTASLNAGGFTLTKIGGNEVTLNNLGEAGLGDINIQAGALKFSGNTTLGASGAVNLSGGATLTLAGAAAMAYDKPINVDATGGQVVYTSGNGTLGGGLAVGGSATIDNAVPLSINGISGSGGTLIKSATDNTLTLLGTINSTAAVNIGAGTLAIENGGTAMLGPISGSTLVVGGSAPGTSLTTPSIIVDTLVIGSSAAPAAVPEPSTWLLLVLGGGWFAMFLRRKAA